MRKLSPVLGQSGLVALPADPLEAALLAVHHGRLRPACAGGLGLVELPVHLAHLRLVALVAQGPVAALGVTEVVAAGAVPEVALAVAVETRPAALVVAGGDAGEAACNEGVAVGVEVGVGLNVELAVEVHDQLVALVVGPPELVAPEDVVLEDLLEAPPVGGHAADDDALASLGLLLLLAAGHAEAGEVVAPEAELVADVESVEHTLRGLEVGGPEARRCPLLEGLEGVALAPLLHLLEGHLLVHVERVGPDAGARLLGELLHLELAAGVVEVVEEGVVAADVPDHHLVVAAGVGVACLPAGRGEFEDAAFAEDHLAGPLEEAAHLDHDVGGHAHLAPVALLVGRGDLGPHVEVEAAHIVQRALVHDRVEEAVEEGLVALGAVAAAAAVGLGQGVGQAVVVAIAVLPHHLFQLLEAAAVAPLEVLGLVERAVLGKQLLLFSL